MSVIEYLHYGRCFECSDLTGLNVKSLMCPKHDYLAKIQKLEARLKEAEDDIAILYFNSRMNYITPRYKEMVGVIVEKYKLDKKTLRAYFSKQGIENQDTL